MIELQKQELVYDIKNTAYIYADAQTKKDDDPHTLHSSNRTFMELKSVRHILTCAA